MIGLTLHGWLVALVFLMAPLAVGVLLFISAPYGRHARDGWGPTLPGRLGWILMESPAVLLFAAFFFTGAHATELVPLALLGMWMLHYIHRTFIFPFRLRTTKPMPLVVAALAFGYQSINATVNAAWIGDLGSYPDSWLLDPRFIVGVLLFALGQLINHHADWVLLNLRRPGERGYKIPHGGMYHYVTSANYFGEIVVWIGWAVATWSLAGLSFAVFTIANLAPRAAEHHRWYHKTFGDDYPSNRKRLIPLLW
jgi:protein-S-isoprenylcysteine O-methyltransferase Ste14